MTLSCIRYKRVFKHVKRVSSLDVRYMYIDVSVHLITSVNRLGVFLRACANLTVLSTQNSVSCVVSLGLYLNLYFTNYKEYV